MEIDGVNYNLDKRASEILQSEITPDKESKMAKMFNIFDKNDDGKLDKGEIDSAMGIFGKSDKNKDNILKGKEIKLIKDEIPELKEFKKKEVKEFVKTFAFVNQQKAIEEEKAAEETKKAEESKTPDEAKQKDEAKEAKDAEQTQETKHKEQEAVKAEDIKDGEPITVQDEIGNTKKINGEIKIEGKDEKSGYPLKITVGKYSYKFEKADEDGKAIYKSMQGAGQTYKTEWQNDGLVLTQREGLEGTTQDGLPDITKNAPQKSEEVKEQDKAPASEEKEVTDNKEVKDAEEAKDGKEVKESKGNKNNEEAKVDADKLAEEKGYRKTNRSDFYYDPQEKMHYRYKDGKFVKYPDIKYFNKDGSYRREYINKDGTRREVDYGKDGYPTGMQARNYKDKAYPNEKFSAKVLGLRETFDKVHKGIWYDPKTKMHYQWDEKAHSFKALDRNLRYISPDGVGSDSTPAKIGTVNGNFAEKWENGTYIYDGKGRVISEPVENFGKYKIHRRNIYDENNRLIQRAYYHENGKLANYANISYDDKGKVSAVQYFCDDELFKGYYRKPDGSKEYYIIDDGQKRIVEKREYEGYNYYTRPDANK